MTPIIIAIVVIVFLIIVSIISIYNGLVKLRNNREGAFANIDVQLKQRHDLIPQLVATVKGYSEHEKTLLENITAARTAAMNVTTKDETPSKEDTNVKDGTDSEEEKSAVDLDNEKAENSDQESQKGDITPKPDIPANMQEKKEEN